MKQLAVLLLLFFAAAGCRQRLGPEVDSARLLDIQHRIAALRGLPFAPAARVEVLDAAAMSATVTRLRESEDSLRILRVWSQIDAAFGDPWTKTPAQAARELPTNNSYGVYSPSDDTLFLSRDRLGPLEEGLAIHRRELIEIVLTHELAHAWQHRHFPALFEPTGDVDCFATRHALLEGDAEVTTLALTEGGTDDAALERYLRFRHAMAVAAGQHPDSNRDWQLRYEKALRFLVGVVRRDGWKGLNALLLEPPTETAAVLAPETASCAAAVPVDSFACPAGWRLVADTAVGSFGMPPLLGIKPAPLAMSGWCGDRLQVCVRDGSADTAWRWASRWRTSDDAARFAAAVRDHLRRRHPELAGEGGSLRPAPACWVVQQGADVIAADTNVPGVVIAPPAIDRDQIQSNSMAAPMAMKASAPALRR